MALQTSHFMLKVSEKTILRARGGLGRSSHGGVGRLIFGAVSVVSELVSRREEG